MHFLHHLTSVIAAMPSRAERPEAGATAVEYGLMVTLIAVVIVSAVAAFGVNVSELFLVPADAFSGGAGGGTP